MRMKQVAWIFITTLLLVTTLSGCSLFRQKIDLENYISWECQGIDGYASLELALDVSGMQADLDEKIKKEEKIIALQSLLEGMSIQGDREENLSNEDVVVIHVEYDELLCKEAGVKIDGNDMKVTITGLEEGELIDLFADVEVQVIGVAPFATAQVVNHSTNEYVKGLNFTVEPSYGFERGATLTIQCNADKAAAREYGYVYFHDTKGVSTTEVDYYVKNAADLESSFLSQLAQEDFATINAQSESTVVRMLYKLTGSSNYLFQYNKEWVERMTLKEIRLMTCSDYALAKEQNKPVNKLYLIWEGYVTNADHGSDAYFCFEYNNIIKQGDGTYFVRHDQPELRYICSNDYEKMMEQLLSSDTEGYEEQNVSLEGVIWENGEQESVTSESESQNSQNNENN